MARLLWGQELLIARFTKIVSQFRLSRIRDGSGTSLDLFAFRLPRTYSVALSRDDDLAPSTGSRKKGILIGDP